MDFANYWFQAPAGGGGYQIGNSLRFRGSSYLQRTFSNTGSRTAWTYSVWVKIADTAPTQHMNLSICSATDRNYYDNFFIAQNTSEIFWNGSPVGGNTYNFTSSDRYRDPSAWYHYLFVWDSANATAGDRVRVYTNGSRPSKKNGTNPSQNYQSEGIGRANRRWRIGWDEYSGYSWYHRGYMAEVNFVDGTALDPTSFGEFNADGVWTPKKVSGLTYGKNGFHLDFSDPHNIGADRSGNGNDFTPHGFELTDTTSHLYDSMADSPTNNFSTMNPLLLGPYGGNSQLQEGNLYKTTGSNGNGVVEGTILIKGGKFYWEVTSETRDLSVGVGKSPHGYGYEGDQTGTYGYFSNGDKVANATYTPYGASYGSGDVIGIAFDADNGTLTFYKNGTSQGTAFTSIPDISSIGYTPGVSGAASARGSSNWINFGQQPFRHTPPAGFEPLSTAGLPDVAITKPSDHFQTVLDTGANILSAAQAAFPNGLWWIKDRANSNQHQLLDSVRGGSLALRTPGNSTTNTTQEFAYTAPSGNSVAWCWATNAAGLNTTAGFQIIQYVGNGANSRDIPHSLGVAPEFVIIKDRGPNGTSQRWWTWHKGLGDGNTLNLDQNGGVIGGTSNGSIQNATATNIVLRSGSSNGNNLNAVSNNFVVYAWAPVPGYSSFGKYVGNSNADGPFIYTGFRIGALLFKTTASGTWIFYDTQRSSYNPVQNRLFPSSTTGDSISSTNQVDILSNGFKVRSTDPWSNESGRVFVYMAFAEHPFGGSNVSPAPAR